MPGHCPKRPRDHHHARHLARGRASRPVSSPTTSPTSRRVIVGAFLAASRGLVRRAAPPAGVGGRARGAAGRRSCTWRCRRDPERRAEWRLWSEMWTYAGRDPDFAAELGRDRRASGSTRSGRARAGARGGPARQHRRRLPRRRCWRASIDGLGLRAWLGDSWEDARGRLVHHMGTLGVPGPVLRRHATERGAAGERAAHADRGGTLATDDGVRRGRRPDRGRPRRRDRRSRHRPAAPTS